MMKEYNEFHKPLDRGSYSRTCLSAEAVINIPLRGDQLASKKDLFPTISLLMPPISVSQSRRVWSHDAVHISDVSVHCTAEIASLWPFKVINGVCEHYQAALMFYKRNWGNNEQQILISCSFWLWCLFIVDTITQYKANKQYIC